MLSQFNRAMLDRRRFCGLTLAGGCALLSNRSAWAARPRPKPRALSFYNLHTDESLSATYWDQGDYVHENLAQIDHHLRDFRTGDVRNIDRGLLDLLHDLMAAMETDEPIHVISGYRSPETNAMLARRSNKVARRSYHVRGMAIDIRLPQKYTSGLRDAGLALARGGVGYYPESDFVHLDTGPVRRW